MISGDRSLSIGKAGAFLSTLEELHTHFERIDIICPRPAGDGRQTRQILGNVHIHPSSSSLLMQPFFIRKKGLELWKEHQHDAMTVHDYPPFYNSIGARMLRRKAKIPTSVEIHHIVGWPKPASLSERIGRTLSKHFLPSQLQHFDAVRTVNESVKNLLTTWGVLPQKIQIVPSAYLDHSLIDAAKNPTKKYDIVFCGRLTANKGLLPLIEALRKISGSTMLVIGDGPLKSTAEARVQALGLGSRVTFAGWLPTSQDTARAIASGRLFVMNSKSEGNPRVAVEAMAYGLPIVATKVGIMPDILREGVNGMFTDGSAKDLARVIGNALQDSNKLESMGREAAAIRNRFEKKASIKNYAEFLKSLSAM